MKMLIVPETASERLTVHVSLLVKQSVKDKLMRGAIASGVSLNNYVNYVLEKALKGDKE